jgi:hypothetical protein
MPVSPLKDAKVPCAGVCGKKLQPARMVLDPKTHQYICRPCLAWREQTTARER